jgi:hypothetical protein
MANEIDQKVISQLLDFSRSVETLTETVEKNINSTDNLVGSQNRFGKKIDSFTEVINGPIQKINQSVSKIPSNNILGAFQEGGIAKDKGKYLVGENGPELVDLPKGSAVIPLNIKDLIEGISKIPELSDIAKENNIGIYADQEDPSLLTSEISDVKNRVSLSKLEEKYDLDLKDQESIDRDKQNKELIDQLKSQSDLLKELKSITQKKISDSIEGAKSEKDAILKNYSDDDNKRYNELVVKIIQSIPKESLNSLSIAKANLIAAKKIEEQKKGNQKEAIASFEELAKKSSDVIEDKKNQKEPIASFEKPEKNKSTEIDELVNPPIEQKTDLKSIETNLIAAKKIEEQEKGNQKEAIASFEKQEKNKSPEIDELVNPPIEQKTDLKSIETNPILKSTEQIVSPPKGEIENITKSQEKFLSRELGLLRESKPKEYERIKEISENNLKGVAPVLKLESDKDEIIQNKNYKDILSGKISTAEIIKKIDELPSGSLINKKPEFRSDVESLMPNSIIDSIIPDIKSTVLQSPAILSIPDQAPKNVLDQANNQETQPQIKSFLSKVSEKIPDLNKIVNGESLTDKLSKSEKFISQIIGGDLNKKEPLKKSIISPDIPELIRTAEKIFVDSYKSEGIKENKEPEIINKKEELSLNKVIPKVDLNQQETSDNKIGNAEKLAKSASNLINPNILKNLEPDIKDKDLSKSLNSVSESIVAEIQNPPVDRKFEDPLYENVSKILNNPNIGELIKELDSPKNTEISKSASTLIPVNETPSIVNSTQNSLIDTLNPPNTTDVKLIRNIENLISPSNISKGSIKKIEDYVKNTESSELSPVNRKTDESELIKVAENLISPSVDLFYKNQKETESAKGENILGAFKTGGIADESGKYLVGENGPEVVSSPLSDSPISSNAQTLSKLTSSAEVIPASSTIGQIPITTQSTIQNNNVTSNPSYTSSSPIVNKTTSTNLAKNISNLIGGENPIPSISVTSAKDISQQVGSPSEVIKSINNIINGTQAAQANPANQANPVTSTKDIPQQVGSSEVIKNISNIINGTQVAPTSDVVNPVTSTKDIVQQIESPVEVIKSISNIINGTQVSQANPVTSTKDIVQQSESPVEVIKSISNIINGTQVAQANPANQANPVTPTKEISQQVGSSSEVIKSISNIINGTQIAQANPINLDNQANLDNPSNQVTPTRDTSQQISSPAEVIKSINNIINGTPVNPTPDSVNPVTSTKDIVQQVGSSSEVIKSISNIINGTQVAQANPANPVTPTKEISQQVGSSSEVIKSISNIINGTPVSPTPDLVNPVTPTKDTSQQISSPAEVIKSISNIINGTQIAQANPLSSENIPKSNFISGTIDLSSTGASISNPADNLTGSPVITQPAEISNSLKKINEPIVPEFKQSITPLNGIKPKEVPSVNESLDKFKDGLSDIFKQNQSFNKNTTDQATSQSGENNQGDKPAVMQLGDSTTTNQDDISKNLNESLSDVKSLLARIAMLLEGPLEFSPMDAPFRPDSRKV